MKLIIDSNNLLHRAHWVYSTRKNTSVYYLFLNSIKKYFTQFNPQEVFCVWDKRLINNVPNYRKQILGENVYKGTRDKERNAEVYKHEEQIRKLTNSIGIKNIYPGILEADDVIWWLCDHYADTKKIVVSVDTDLYQLVDTNTTVYTPIRDILITPENFEDITSVKVSDYVAYKSLIGDKSDNINGITGVGPKRAKKIIQDGIKRSLSRDEYKLFLRNVDLISLESGVKHHPEEDHIYRAEVYAKGNLTPDFKRFKTLCEQYNAHGILNNFDRWREDLSIPDRNNSIIDIVNKLVTDK